MTESKSPAAKEVWITGIGIVSSLGEGLDAHWDALNAGKINVDDKRFAPYIVHPLAPVTFDAQIPKKGDQRQMEAWQRIGTYAAGLALDSAGIKGNKEILGRTDMIVAAGGGERDLAVDLAIMTEKFAPVWQRETNSGFALGSAGCFLVLESREHAEARGAKPYAKLTKVVADLAQRKRPGAVTQSLEALWPKLGMAGDSGNLITGATGAEPVTLEEKAFLRQHPGFAVRATGTMFGHTLETQFPLGLALAALSLSRGALFPPNDPTGFEVEKAGPPDQIVVVGAGHWQGEGMALVEAVK